MEYQCCRNHTKHGCRRNRENRKINGGGRLSPQTDVLAYAKTIYNSMLQQIYVNPNQTVFEVNLQPALFYLLKT